MDQILQYMNLPVVLSIASFLVGNFLKKNPDFPNQFIPLATWVVGLFGYAVVPKEANAAGFLTPILGIASPFVASLAHTFITTGIHSVYKNLLGQAIVPMLTKSYAPRGVKPKA